MVSMEQLRFAVFFPFSNTSKKILRETAFSLNDFSEEAKTATKSRLLKAFEKKPLNISNNQASKSCLLSLLLSYPAARIIVSLLGTQFFSGFAYSSMLSTKQVLENEKDSMDLCLKLLKEQKIFYAPFLKKERLLIKVNAKDYLQNFSVYTPSIFSVELSKGKIFLTKKQLTKFVLGITYKKALTGLPLKTAGAPKWVELQAKTIAFSFRKQEEKSFEKIGGFTGKTNISAFPPCMKSLYSKLVSGENLPHLARFYLASFLASINMPKQGIIKAFSFASNYDEKVTVYQVENIFKKKYAAPSCQKMREQGYCPDLNCSQLHPIKTYMSNLKQQKKTGNPVK